jgi:branched-chain amino acid transport system substrate-binding protein
MLFSPSTTRLVAFLALFSAMSVHSPVAAQNRYDPGASDSEIKVGNTMPYSGPLSSFGTEGRTLSAYFKKVNEEGGIRGRKITFISLDDAYSPPKTVEMTRRLVEQDQVLLLAGMLGSPTNSSIQKYVNAAHIPHLFVLSGASKFSDPKNFPWTLPLVLTYAVEAQIYAKHILSTKPNAKIAVISQNDDYGKDYLNGFKQGLGEHVQQIVAEATYETTDATVDSQILRLQASGADVLLHFSAPKFAAQAIRKVYDLGWRPTQYVANPASGVSATLAPAGVDRSIGIISAATAKDPRDPQWADDAGMKEYFSFMKAYYPEGDPLDGLNAAAYNAGSALVQVLRQCGDDLRRDNVIRQAANLKNLQLPLLLPGIVINTSADDYRPFKRLELRRFDGTRYIRFGELISI